MKKIDNRDDFNLALNFISKIDYSFEFEKEISLLPEYLREIILKNNSIYPADLTFEFFKELFIESILKIVSNYIIDNNSEKIINKISEFATRDEVFIKDLLLSFDKGILLMGKVGCGKTVIFGGLVNFLRIFRFYTKNSFRYEKLTADFLPAYYFTEGFSKKGYDIFEDGIVIKDKRKSIMSDRLFIDDIGSENVVSNFGNTTNVIGELILRRYDCKLKTFATTNLDRKTLKSFYGDRVYSRMNEMFNFIVVDGDDRRI